MSLSNDDIIKLLGDYEKNTKALKKELYSICWYMRGGISITEAHMMCAKDRIIISEIIKNNMEVTKETQLPFF